jgi:hypothetical protein
MMKNLLRLLSISQKVVDNNPAMITAKSLIEMSRREIQIH